MPAEAAFIIVKDAALPTVNVYFATGKAEMPGDPAQGLSVVLVYLRANPSAKAVISGYHDATGDLAHNQELAKQRAMSVRDAIKAAGIAEERFELKKPEQTQDAGSNAEARRVEAKIQ